MLWNHEHAYYIYRYIVNSFIKIINVVKVWSLSFLKLCSCLLYFSRWEFPLCLSPSQKRMTMMATYMRSPQREVMHPSTPVCPGNFLYQHLFPNMFKWWHHLTLCFPNGNSHSAVSQKQWHRSECFCTPLPYLSLGGLFAIMQKLKSNVEKLLFTRTWEDTNWYKNLNFLCMHL